MLLNNSIFRDKDMDGRNLLTPYILSSINQVSTYFDKEWKIYEIFQNKMHYTDEEFENDDFATYTEYSLVGQVSHPFERIWESFEIDQERLPYFGDKSTCEGKEDLGEGCCLRIKFDGEYIHIDNNR